MILPIYKTTKQDTQF